MIELTSAPEPYAPFVIGVRCEAPEGYTFHICTFHHTVDAGARWLAKFELGDGFRKRDGFIAAAPVLLPDQMLPVRLGVRP